MAQGIDLYGNIVGYAQTTPDAEGRQRNAAFLSMKGGDGSYTMYNLNDLLTETDRQVWYLQSAYDLNAAGQIVGQGYFNGDLRGFRYTPGYTDASGVFHPAVVSDLGSVNGASVTEGRGINATGSACGGYPYNGSYSRGCLYTDESGASDIGDLGVDEVIARGGINGSDQIAGWARNTANEYRAFRFTPGTGMLDLGALAKNRGSAQSRGNDINDNGQVAGISTAGGSSEHAFRYTDGAGMQDLGTLGGANSEAWGINSTGDTIVGWADTSSGVRHVFLYTDADGIMDLEASITNLPPEWSGLLGNREMEMNDSGEVCGSAGSPGSWQAYVLTPAP